MATFVYSALKADGGLAKGEIQAGDRPEALRKLDKSGLQPVNLTVKDSAAVVAKKARDAKSGKKEAIAAAEEPLPTGPVKLKRAQVVLFTEELSDLLGAGLQLEPALQIMEARDELSELKTVTRILRQEVRDGSSFSAALRKASKSFGDLYCSMAQAGEVSGALSTILRRQAEYLVAMQELQSKVLFALIYPSFLVASGIAVCIIFVSYLIPRLTSMLASMDKELPPVAKAMVYASDVIKNYWWLIGILVIGGVWLFKYLTTQGPYRAPWDKAKLQLPLVGPVLQARFFVQFLETLANLTSNGLPLLRALELSRDAVQNIYLRGLLDVIIEQVGEGSSLSRTLKKVGFFPPLLTDMITVGEQTGDLPHSLERTAARYDKELQKKIDSFTALIQPAIVVLMAVIVGGMAYMMITVILESITGLQQRK